ncbi:MAG: hypothetical protein KAX38_08985 [Candidatus Krumholzibacteria bacterium]|nr:hypothetical protein [Candidatus Krumholzibacteria bacterium]
MSLSEDDIYLLIQIVQKDLEIQERRKLLEEIPVRIEEIDKKIKEMEEKFQEGQDLLDKLNKERRHLEREAIDQSKKITDKKIEREKLKSNKEYKAMNAEIEYLSKLVDKEEERILVILEETETKGKEVGAISDRINVEKDSLLADRQRLEEDAKKSTEALTILEDEKVRILPHISDGIRRLYNRILSVKGDSGVANLVGDICQGCYSRVPPQKAHEIRKNSQILTCEVCGRILVYYQVD